MNIHRRVRAFERSAGKKEKKKSRLLFFPLFLQLWTRTSPWGSRSSVGLGCELSRCPRRYRWDRGAWGGL